MRDGLRAAFPEAELVCKAGVALEGGDTAGIAAAAEAARHADIVVLCLGEGASLNGEATSRADLDLPGHQRALAEAVLATGTPCVAIVFCGPAADRAVAGGAGRRLWSAPGCSAARPATRWATCSAAPWRRAGGSP